MPTIPQFVSPKQAARAMGVSESSLKRWCDQGLIHTMRTGGGHRKLSPEEVVRFARESGRPLSSPEALGLRTASAPSQLGLARGREQLTDALLRGDELLALRVVIDLYLARHSLSTVFDEVIAAAFHAIGDRWACREADVYQERRGCEIALRVLHDLRKLQRQPASSLLALGGTAEGDHYTLPSTMAELTLRECGFQAAPLGTSIPFPSLAAAVRDARPAVFWLSVSHVPDGAVFVAHFQELSQVCNEMGTALVVGGRALGPDLRQQLIYSAYCDTMRQLEAFGTTLQRSLYTGRRRASSHVPRAGLRNPAPKKF